MDQLSDRLKGVLRYMPAPVGIVTSFDDENCPVGLAMSAIMPVSLDPCLMAISINRDNTSFDHLLKAGAFCINLLNDGMKAHFLPFADYKGRERRFRDPSWKDFKKLRYIDRAPASIFCRIESAARHGTHDIVVGEVFELFAAADENVLGWANGSLGTMLPIDKIRSGTGMIADRSAQGRPQ